MGAEYQVIIEPTHLFEKHCPRQTCEPIKDTQKMQWHTVASALSLTQNTVPCACMIEQSDEVYANYRHS